MFFGLIDREQRAESAVDIESSLSPCSFSKDIVASNNEESTNCLNMVTRFNKQNVIAVGVEAKATSSPVSDKIKVVLHSIDI